METTAVWFKFIEIIKIISYLVLQLRLFQVYYFYNSLNLGRGVEMRILRKFKPTTTHWL